jgi:hypothetical protein
MVKQEAVNNGPEDATESLRKGKSGIYLKKIKIQSCR